MARGNQRDTSTECKVYIGDLSKDADEKEIERAFGYYGRLKSVWVARNPPGFAFVEFEDPKDAEDAVRALDGTNICGVRVRVEHATGKVRPKPWLRNRGGGAGGGYGGGGRPPSPRPLRRSSDYGSERCAYCGERGHPSYDCPRERRGRRRSPSRSRSRERRRSYSRSLSRSKSRDRMIRRRSVSRD